MPGQNLCLTRLSDPAAILEPAPCEEDNPYQEWDITPRSQAFFAIRSQENLNLCLALRPADDLTAGVVVGLSDCTMTSDNPKLEQRWLLAEIPNDPEQFKLASYISGLCITAQGPEVGDKVELQPCDGDSVLQKWKQQALNGDDLGLMLVDSPGRCLYSPSAGADLVLSDCAAGSAWVVAASLGGLVTITGAPDNQGVNLELASSSEGEAGSLIRSDTTPSSAATSLLNRLWLKI
jgi:hypothetical protein